MAKDRRSDILIGGESGLSAKPTGPTPRNQKAIAIQYDQDSGEAPVVVAKGQGRVAEQILNLAFDAGVKVRQDADLVQVLDQVDVDSEIPLEAFTAVAEILTYIYRANRIFGEGGGYQELKDEIEASDAHNSV